MNDLLDQNVPLQSGLHTPQHAAEFRRDGYWADLTLADVLDQRAADYAGKPAIVEDARSLSFADLVRISENVAAALWELGVRRGDTVAIQSPNWAELPIVHFATNRIGAIFVPLSEGFRERELSHLLRQSKAKVVFCPSEFRNTRFAELIATLQPELPDLRHIVTMRGAAIGDASTFDAMAGDDRWRHAHGADWLIDKRTHADAPSHVMVSSGSTGLPKCSLFSDNNTLVKLVRQFAVATEMGPDDTTAALAPAGTGSTGYTYAILCTLMVGGTVVMLAHWNGHKVEEALQLLEKHRCTAAVVVPAQLVKLVQVASQGTYDLHRFRFITNAGAKLPPSVAKEAEEVLGCVVQSCYGTSEAGATSMTSVRDDIVKRHTTVGRPAKGQLVLVLDDRNRPVPMGQVGEVCWKGPNKSFGFLHDPESTGRVWDEQGMFHSGDLGRFDDEGYLYIVGRKKDMIIRGGQNINPGAVEEVVMTHPDVSEVAIVGVPDAVLGERVAACITVKGAAQPTLESLKLLVRQRGLAAWNQPELLVILPELPRNAGGKFDKMALGRIAATVQAAQAAAQSAR